MLMTFFTILAWIGAIGGTLLWMFVFYLAFTYDGSTTQVRDQLNGVVRTWPAGPWAFGVSVISIVFLIAKYLS